MKLGVLVSGAVALLAITLSGCGSGDSTVSMTPEPTTDSPVATAPTADPAIPTTSESPDPAPPADPCAVNLVAPEIGRAVAELPPDPRSGQAWSPEPLAGNYNECAPLSVVIIRANTNADNPNTRAVMFHLGKFIPSGVPDTYGFNDVDPSGSTGDTVALRYDSGIEGLASVVKFRWNGNGVELIGNTGS